MYDAKQTFMQHLTEILSQPKLLCLNISFPDDHGVECRMYICVVLSQARSETSLRHEDASRSLRLKSDDRGAGTGAKRLTCPCLPLSTYVPNMQKCRMKIEKYL